MLNFKNVIYRNGRKHALKLERIQYHKLAEISIQTEFPTKKHQEAYHIGKLAKLKLSQGGIIFWLRGSLQDVPDISPEIALMKNDDNDQICIEIYIF